ncbi:MAG: prolyl aminopeptidase [Gammaproteobacteria bacterium]|nr:prolyl aminopeptidase [Gammaproteobacteria bacterium]MCY4281470.1 prolyl aminopeptidase [Gammaproteobacteria bacterium]
MRELYPQIDALQRYHLQVDEVHTVYAEEAGNPHGIPVIFLHGGPGSGCNENHRRYFNPKKYRIVLFDQRGCNRSTPAGETRNNSTPELLQDVERIRDRLGIEQWLVFGGSWGATLGLLYAQSYPSRVLGLILRGTFLARQQDLNWFVRQGAGMIFPDYWQEFTELIPQAERDDLVTAYHTRVHGADRRTREAAALAWSQWAGRLVTYLLPGVGDYTPSDVDKTVCEVLIETHYAKHRYFIAENQILDNAALLPAVPIRIIHGRRDLTCTLDASWSLHRARPDAQLVIVREGGHLAGEAVMTDALVTATDEFAHRLS